MIMVFPSCESLKCTTSLMISLTQPLSDKKSLDSGAFYSLSIFLYLVFHTVSDFGQVFFCHFIEVLTNCLLFKLVLSASLTQIAVSKIGRLLAGEFKADGQDRVSL